MSVKLNHLVARVVGEMKPSDIPVAKGVDVDAIKAGDDDPLEVVVEVPEGKSTRGWYYTGQSLKDIVNAVNTKTLSGFLGHQKEEEIANEFPTPVTHWIGGVWKNGKAYFRGIVDKSATDLKRWIRAGRIKQVSIFGRPKLSTTANGEIKVVGYGPLSIDWTPLDRAGMPTRIVAMGEMDSTFADNVDDVTGELDGSYEDLRLSIYRAVHAQLGGDDAYVGIERVFPDHVIVTYERHRTRRFYRIPYTLQGDTVVLGDKTEVELKERREYVPVGEMKEDDEQMTLEEKLAAIRSAIAKGETDLATVFGEMGITKEAGLKALVGNEYDKAKAGAEFGAKLAAALGFGKDTNAEDALVLAGEMAEVCKGFGLVPGADVSAVKATIADMQQVWKALGFDQDTPENAAEVAGEMARLYTTQSEAAFAERVDKLIGEKVSGEMAQGLVKKMLKSGHDATDEQISGEIDQLLADDVVKGLIGNTYVDQSAGVGTTGGQSDTKQNVRVKTVSL